jgi:hypothetical protein
MLALHMLAQENFTIYAPKLRERRNIRGVHQLQIGQLDYV